MARAQERLREHVQGEKRQSRLLGWFMGGKNEASIQGVVSPVSSQEAPQKWHPSADPGNTRGWPGCYVSNTAGSVWHTAFQGTWKSKGLSLSVMWDLSLDLTKGMSGSDAPRASPGQVLW